MVWCAVRAACVYRLLSRLWPACLTDCWAWAALSTRLASRRGVLTVARRGRSLRCEAVELSCDLVWCRPRCGAPIPPSVHHPPSPSLLAGLARFPALVFVPSYTVLYIVMGTGECGCGRGATLRASYGVVVTRLLACLPAFAAAAMGTAPSCCCGRRWGHNNRFFRTTLAAAAAAVTCRSKRCTCPTHGRQCPPLSCYTALLLGSLFDAARRRQSRCRSTGVGLVFYQEYTQLDALHWGMCVLLKVPISLPCCLQNLGVLANAHRHLTHVHHPRQRTHTHIRAHTQTRTHKHTHVPTSLSWGPRPGFRWGSCSSSWRWASSPSRSHRWWTPKTMISATSLNWTSEYGHVMCVGVCLHLVERALFVACESLRRSAEPLFCGPSVLRLFEQALSRARAPGPRRHANAEYACWLMVRRSRSPHPSCTLGLGWHPRVSQLRPRRRHRCGADRPRKGQARPVRLRLNRLVDGAHADPTVARACGVIVVVVVVVAAAVAAVVVVAAAAFVVVMR